MRNLGIPGRYLSVELGDIPKSVPYRQQVVQVVDGVDKLAEEGGLIWLAGPRESGREAAAFVLTKAFRRARRRGRCIEGNEIGREIGSMFDEDVAAFMRRMQFLTLYDVNPEILRDFEIRLVLTTIVRFLNDCKVVILTSNDIDSWGKHAVLSQIAPLAKAWGTIIPCTGTWLPKQGKSKNLPTSPGDLAWG
jgi:hypothetical protein